MMKEKDILSFFTTHDISLCFVGHTHLLASIEWNGTKVTREKLVSSDHCLKEGSSYIINCGSVGQPRDGNSDAKYILWHTRESRIEIVRVPYDFRTTCRKIEARGFPKIYGQRLG